MKTLVFSAAAAKDFDRLPRDVREQLEEALASLATSGRGDVKRLQGSPYSRLRVGRYRVVFNESGIIILLIYIGKRETTTYR